MGGGNENVDEKILVGEGPRLRRLVIVAEDSLIVEAITIALRKSGEFLPLAHVNAGAATTAKILEGGPDVVLIDQADPAERTVALIQQVKQEREQIVIIVLTLSPGPPELDAIFAAGATAAISKAANPVALATLIRETIDGRVLHVHKPAARLDGSTPADGADPLLSSRELEVLKLVAGGATNGEIARRLWVTEQTVKFHLSNVYRKIGVANRTEASRYAHVNGLLDDDKRTVGS
jgi:DNA-binding NarL/FixJ family response regulator